MGHFIDLHKIADPDFAVPGRKPIGPVKADKQSGAVATGIFTPNQRHDLIAPATYTYDPNAPGWGEDSGGVYFETTNNGSFNFYGVTFSGLPSIRAGFGQEGVTVLLKGKSLSRGGSAVGALLVSDAANRGLGINSLGEIVWYVSADVRLTSSNRISAGDEFVLIAGYKYNSADTFIYLNGILTTGNPGNITLQTSFTNLGGNPGQGFNAINVRQFAQFSGLLPQTRVRALAADSYRELLTPAIPFQLYVPSVGGFSITDIDLDDTVYDGQAAVIHGSGFGVTQGQVLIGDVQQTVTGWADTAINITVVKGGLSLGAQTLYVRKPA